MTINQAGIFFILVEPLYRGNIGAVARVMKNFGFTNLRVVGTIPAKEDHYLAVHSEDIMNNIVVFPRLAEALEDIDCIIAFSRRSGRKKPVDLKVKELGYFTKKLPRSKIAFVFGRETFGLTDEEADLCPVRCMIPADEKFPSLNLAQAAAIAAYELFSVTAKDNCNTDIKLAGDNKVAASCKSIVNYLKEIDYFGTGVEEKTERKLRNILMKSYSTEENILFLEKMFHRISVLFKKRCERTAKHTLKQEAN